MLKCTFLNNVHGLSLNFSESLKIIEEYSLELSVDSKKITDFYDKTTQSIIGISQFQNTNRVKTFLYTTFEVPEEKLNEAEVTAYLLEVSTHLSTSCWLIKDSSIRFEIGHFKYTDDIKLSIHSNFTNSLFTNHLGEKTNTAFNLEELTKAIVFNKFLLDLHYSSENDSLSTHASANRFKRAFYFVDLARRSFDIGTKVSIFCSALECLFSVAQSELKHRLSETIANFLEDDFTAKKEIYSKVKQLYDLRSSVTHGAGIKKKLINNDLEKLKNLALNCDNIVRRCLTKLILQDELKKLYLDDDNNHINEFLLDLNFK